MALREKFGSLDHLFGVWVGDRVGCMHHKIWSVSVVLHFLEALQCMGSGKRLKSAHGIKNQSL
jgi:hypothetical protein